MKARRLGMRGKSKYPLLLVTARFLRWWQLEAVVAGDNTDYNSIPAWVPKPCFRGLNSSSHTVTAV